MQTAISRQRCLNDRSLPAMPAMLGPGAGGMLDCLAAATGGGRVRAARAVQVNWSPGTSMTVQYLADVQEADGTPSSRSYVLKTGRDLPAGALLLGRGVDRVAAWPLEQDRLLPGLAVVLDPRQVSALGSRLGAAGREWRPRLIAYRPGRRAVVELRSGDVRVFAKVVPPSSVAALQERHRLVAASAPAPQSHGWSPELGIVLLAALPGSTLREALASPGDLPSVATVCGLLDRLPAMRDDVRSPATPLEDVPRHARLLRRLLPDHAPRVGRLAAQLDDDVAPPGPLVPVHGDFHEAQVMVEGGRIRGLLDIDTVGLGFRVDDLASFLGHLAVWEAMSPDPSRVRDYARSVLAAADREAHPGAVRLRIAAVIFALATGPFRVQEDSWPLETVRRLYLAERWATSAGWKTHHPTPTPSRRPAAI